MQGFSFEVFTTLLARTSKELDPEQKKKLKEERYNAVDGLNRYIEKPVGKISAGENIWIICHANGSLNNRFGSLKDNSGSLDDENSKESGSLKDNLGSLSNEKSTDHGSLNLNETAQTGLEDLVDIRKKKIINAIKDNPETTIGALSSSLSIPERTIYREIEWLKENGCLERIGSKKFGRWNVIKELK